MSDILKSLLHPSEVTAMFKLKFGGKMRKAAKGQSTESKNMSAVDYCYATLPKVSRSFAVVIQQLPAQLRDCVCIFYLVLRGLDSVEDDMTLDNKVKLPLLLKFHELLYQDGWNIKDVGDGPEYRVLLANFEKVIEVFKGLAPGYQAAIKDITMRMGAGMAEFATKTGQGCPTIEDYNLYCHYVAGLVGHGLSALFSASGLEDHNLKNELRVSNSMGLFLQKTNIIRDYLEDLDQSRTWWPKEIWSIYANDLSDFKRAPTADKSLECLNHMVNDALSHVPDCLKYLSMIKDRKVFEFCAIPQIMAIATLAEVYNNKDVFTRVVKVRKGLSCRMMLECSNMAQVAQWFNQFADRMLAKVPSKGKDRNAETSLKLIQQVKHQSATAYQSYASNGKLVKPGQEIGIPRGPLRAASLFAWVMFIVAMIYLVLRYRARHTEIAFTGTQAPNINAYDLSALFGAFISVAYIFGFFGMHLL